MAQAMNEFLKRLKGKIEHRSVGDEGSGSALETNGTRATLDDEIEAFERIFAEQLARLKARAAKGNGIAPKSRQENQPRLYPAATMEPGRKTHEVPSETQNDHAEPVNADRPDDHRDTDHAKQTGELQLAYAETNAALARQAEAADTLSKNFAEWKAVVESKFDGAEHQTRRIAAALERVLIKVQELASRAEEQERTLSRQQADITELRDRLNRLPSEIDATSFAAIPASDLPNGTEDSPVQGVPTTEALEEEKGPTEHAVSPKFAFPKVDQPFLTREGTQRITFELAEELNVMETLASLLLLRHVKALGESLEKFPLERLSELFDALACEVPDEQRRADFRRRLDRTASVESLKPLS